MFWARGRPGTEYDERVLDAGRRGTEYDEHVLDAGRPGGWNTTSVFWARGGRGRTALLRACSGRGGGRGRTALLPVEAFRKAVEILAAGSCYDDQVLDTNATKPQRIQSRLNR